MSTTCIHCAQKSKYRLCDTCLKDDQITITPSKAIKKYKLVSTDLEGFTLTKRRYYLLDIEQRIDEIRIRKNEEKERQKNKLIQESIIRKNKMKEYFVSKPNDFVNFVNSKQMHLLTNYYDSKLDESVYVMLEHEYEKYKQKIKNKQLRREDILSVIEKHEMKDFTIYRDKLNARITDYVNNEEHTLLGYFLIIQEEYNRTKELYDKMLTLGIQPRLDSYLCRTYINEGINGVRGNTNDMGRVDSLDDIVDVMYAMSFLYTKTKYQSKLNHVHNNKYLYRDMFEDLATIAKKQAIRDWLKTNAKENLPKRLWRYA